MASESDDLALAAEFPPASRDEWRKLVDGVLKGAPYDKLTSRTSDALPIAPIYEPAQGATVVGGRPAAAPWQIMQRIDHPDAAIANAQALHDLENGASGLALIFAGSAAAHGFGLPPTAEALARALDGVFLDAGIAIELEIGPGAEDLPAEFAKLVAERNVSPAKVDVRIGQDPIGAAARAGGCAAAWPDLAARLGASIKDLAGVGLKGKFAVADGRIVHDAGGSEAQELAFLIATLTAYLRAMEGAGIALDDARRLVYARLSADTDQFLTLAKFRALRMLWARVEQSCGLAPEPLFVAADTAWRMLTQRDPYVNLLRATIAVFSAGLGGASSIAVLPHTLALGLPDRFARRLARNTQLILLEESNLAKVTDPAAGSGGIEALTQELCTTAWALFQEIERAGGAFAALEQNLLQKKVAATRTARNDAIAKRRNILTGASEFPNLAEAPVEVLDLAPVPLPPAETKTVGFDALTPTRLAAPFEHLRDVSDRLLAETGQRPRIFLASLGTPADFTARATFTKSLFEAGGIEAAIPDGFPPGAGQADWHKLMAAFKASGARLACLCSSDAVYEAHAVSAAMALQAAGAKHIYLAGRPGGHETAYRAAGIHHYVFAGLDAVATLQAAYDNLGTKI